MVTQQIHTSYLSFIYLNTVSFLSSFLSSNVPRPHILKVNKIGLISGPLGGHPSLLPHQSVGGVYANFEYCVLSMPFDSLNPDFLGLSVTHSEVSLCSPFCWTHVCSRHPSAYLDTCNTFLRSLLFSASLLAKALVHCATCFCLVSSDVIRHCPVRGPAGPYY